MSDKVNMRLCPNCMALLVHANLGNGEVDVYCEDCGWPDECRGSGENGGVMARKILGFVLLLLGLGGILLSLWVECGLWLIAVACVLLIV